MYPNGFTSFLLLCLLPLTLPAQTDQPESFGKNATLFDHKRPLGVEKSGPTFFFNPEWAPFYHGVASGDPLEDRVIIWTRVTPDSTVADRIEVTWMVATDPKLANLIVTGNSTTDERRDYTVKVDVTGLEPGTTYYYGFRALGRSSLTGKTKTTPAANAAVNHLKFAVVSCSNYQAGYFNAYGRLAERTDLDAVIHLGDYIYEYGNRVYGNPEIAEERPLEPETEIVTLSDYRARYSTYHLDTNLARLHQQHAMISVWDDHESANNAWTAGAQNHQPNTEGPWAERLANARRAYFEWMPIRDNDTRSVYRTIRYGKLVDLILLDTRLEGREKQINDVTDPLLYAEERTLLGQAQKTWFFEQLKNSRARWKVIGQQVVFAPFTIGWASLVDKSRSYNEYESAFLDIWDGYPVERSEVMDYLRDQELDNVVILTGDFHSSFAFDVTDAPNVLSFHTVPTLGEVPFYQPSPAYNSVTGRGSVAVEFVTPSVTSANFDENIGLLAVGLQNQINRDIIPGTELNLGNPNPHMKYVDLIRHGHFILDIKPDSVQANWYYTPILQVTEQEDFGGARYTRRGENHLITAVSPSPPKAKRDVPAPADPPNLSTPVREADRLAILSVFPNPFHDRIALHCALNAATRLRITLHTADGRQISTLLDERVTAGIYTLDTPVGELPAGVYLYRIEAGEQVEVRKVIKVKR